MEKGSDTIVVSNFKSIDQMKREGGCGYWAIGDDVTIVKRHNINYVLCCFNRARAKEEHQELTHDSGEPYFIATLSGLPTLAKHSYVDDTGKKHRGRQLLKLGRYAAIPTRSIPFKTLEEGHTYRNIKAMGIDLKQLEMTNFESLSQ